MNTMLGSINEYNPNITYSKGSYVIHGGTMYESVVDITLPEEWTVEHWKPATVLSLLQSVSADVPFKFGVDENGNYGFIKDGADTVTPFKQSNPIHMNIKTPSFSIDRSSNGLFWSFKVKDLSLLKIDSIWLQSGSTANIKFVVLGGQTPPDYSNPTSAEQPVTSWGSKIYEKAFGASTTTIKLNDLEVDISDYDYIILWLNVKEATGSGYCWWNIDGIDIS